MRPERSRAGGRANETHLAAGLLPHVDDGAVGLFRRRSDSRAAAICTPASRVIVVDAGYQATGQAVVELIERYYDTRRVVLKNCCPARPPKLGLSVPSPKGGGRFPRRRKRAGHQGAPGRIKSPTTLSASRGFVGGLLL